MFDYVYTDHAQYTIKTYAKMALFPLLLTGPLSLNAKRRAILNFTTAMLETARAPFYPPLLLY